MSSLYCYYPTFARFTPSNPKVYWGRNPVNKYVIERYRHIPQGGNWEDIADKLTNYADVQRTHSNIYRRLKWREPSITIGHY